MIATCGDKSRKPQRSSGGMLHDDDKSFAAAGLRVCPIVKMTHAGGATLQVR